MNSTYSSNLVSRIELKNCQSLNIKFNYNFFESDETVRESSLSSKNLLTKNPRYVELTFAAPQDVKIAQNGVKLVKNNLDKIYSHEDIGSSTFTAYYEQDGALNRRIYDSILRAAKIRGIDGNFTDIAESLGKIFGKSLDREILQDLASSFDKTNITFLEDKRRIKEIEQKTNRNNCVLINDKFIYDLLTSRDADNELDKTTALSISSIQSNSRAKTASVGSIDFITIVEPVETRSSSNNEFNLDLELCSILIYRKETKEDGTSETILLDVINPTSIGFLDFKVKVDSKYEYWTTTVYKLKTITIAENTGQVICASILLRSNQSDVLTTNCLNEIPPEPPTDFDARWDYQRRALILSWNFPVDVKRNIKYFQVYRRSNVFESFELMVEYDFNDNLKKIDRKEVTESLLHKKIDNPILIFEDSMFNKDSKYVYAVATVDAYGMVSNYSQQIEVSFDRLKNKLIKNVISASGAPRQYPNLLLENIFFGDLLKTSNKKRLKVYFDPEYLKLKDKNDNTFNLLKYKGEGIYTINVLDINRSEMISIPIEIINLLENKKS